jgi:hypothetical protein
MSSEGRAAVSEEWIGLADAIAALRRELNDAMKLGRKEHLRFGLGPVEMEFLLDVTREGSGEAGIRFGVVTVGGKGGITSGSSHRVKLQLHPHDSSGRPAQISDIE